ncbi:AAA family ATPase [Thomasclavelia cocleata]|uniref:AAA family ATPase n=1 Tax=Thomasclavelia cocleata TaxID=69824 RepID=UPI0024318ADC|nr:AAA family ATPase [Thomasclavelia cocleata]MCI9131182.1 AAA family ATPase [Thomasclavelia cocleata]
MNIELLYLYVGENNTSVKDIDICFSHEYNIKYYEKLLRIEKKKDYQYKGFYGEFVKSCSLIVGKNGSGKTTLLNFLGLLSDNLNKCYNLRDRRVKKLKASKAKYNCNDFGCWFALYIVDDQFYIEGFNFERLFGYNRFNDKIIKMDFSLFINYDFNINTMQITEMSNHHSTTYVDFFYYKKLSESIESDFENTNKSNLYREDCPGQDYTIRLNRREIVSASVNNIYKLFKNDKDLLFDQYFANESKIIFEIYGFDYEDSKQFNKIIESKFNFSTTKQQKTSKEIFISNLYYSLAFGLWNAYFGRDAEEDIVECKATDILTGSKFKERDIALYYLNSINYNDNVTNIPNYVNFLDHFVKCLENIDKKYFMNGNRIEFSLTQHDNLIQKLLDFYCSLSRKYSLKQFISLKYTNLSSGEHEYIEVFGSLMKVLSEINPNTECKSRVLLLDEPDRTFHPEWISNYIYKLTKILNHYGEESGISFQVIITTHSPFMVSDVLKEDIYKIKNENGYKKIINTKYGFASNYYDIMNDTFFLTNSVGEFARNKIENINKQINAAENINELTDLKKIINAIGDNYLKNILNANYTQKLKEISSNEDKSLIEERISEIKGELRILEERIMKKHE